MWLWFDKRAKLDLRSTKEFSKFCLLSLGNIFCFASFYKNIVHKHYFSIRTKLLDSDELFIVGSLSILVVVIVKDPK